MSVARLLGGLVSGVVNVRFDMLQTVERVLADVDVLAVVTAQLTVEVHWRESFS